MTYEYFQYQIYHSYSYHPSPETTKQIKTDYSVAQPEDTEIPHISPRHAGHSLCLQLSCRYQCFYIIWHACQLEPWCATLTHRDFRSSVMFFGPGESSDVPRRDALCWKYASNLTVPYSWNKKLDCGIYIFPLGLQHFLCECRIDM